MKIDGMQAHRRTVSLALGVAAIAAVTMVSGCTKKPGGQVVAVVNNEEITQPELRAEADAAGIPADRDMHEVAPQILSRVIERNLLADYAHDQGLDRGPEFVQRRRQIEQSLLANLAVRKITQNQTAPTPAETQAFIAQNKSLFAGREKLTLDQVRMATPPAPAQIKALTSLGSLDAIQAKLKAGNTPFARGVATLDTGSVDPQVGRQIDALPNNQVFDLSTNGTTYFSAITGRTAAVAPSDQWSRAAQALLQRERAQKALGDVVGKLKAKAKIDYDPAFKPAAKSPS